MSSSLLIGAGAAGRLQATVDRLARTDADARVLVRKLAGALTAAVPADRLLLLRTDPTTVLPLDGVVEALPSTTCRPFWDNELLEDDVNKFVALARGPVAATLRQATGGDLSRSRRYRTVYRGLDVADELRASLTARDGSCWGIVQLIRTSRPFTSAERDLVAAVAPRMAAALRARFGVAGPVDDAPTGPELLVLGPTGEIESVTDGAWEWLAELSHATSTGMRPVPEPVYTVAGRARAARAGRSVGPASARIRTPNRGWLHLHASCLDTPQGPSGSVAVVFTPARAPDLVPLLALGYRLTPREQEVLGHLARGLGTAELTRQLGISPHTVRDHLKSLFAKVGVRSRAELVARIFAEHYVDRLEARVERLDPQ